MIYIQTVFNLCIVREVHNYVIIDLISWTLCGFCDFYYYISVLFMWYLMLRTMNITFFIYKETSKPFFSQLFPLISVSMGSAGLVTSSQSVPPPALTTSNPPFRYLFSRMSSPSTHSCWLFFPDSCSSSDSFPSMCSLYRPVPSVSGLHMSLWQGL